MQIQVKGSRLECELVSTHYLELEENADVQSIDVGRIYFDKTESPPKCKVEIDLIYKTYLEEEF